MKKKKTSNQSQKSKPSVEVKDLRPGSNPRGGKAKTADKAADAMDKYIRS